MEWQKARDWTTTAPEGYRAVCNTTLWAWRRSYGTKWTVSIQMLIITFCFYIAVLKLVFPGLERTLSTEWVTAHSPLSSCGLTDILHVACGRFGMLPSLYHNCIFSKRKVRDEAVLVGVRRQLAVSSQMRIREVLGRAACIRAESGGDGVPLATVVGNYLQMMPQWKALIKEDWLTNGHCSIDNRELLSSSSELC